MTAATAATNGTFDLEPRTTPTVVRARPAGALHDVFSIAGRALRAVPRDLEAIIPPIFIAIFFFVVNIGTLENLTQNNIQGFDYTAFEMATAVLLGVTGVSRAQSLVVDVQSGYFDRLLLTPVRRSAILVGHMVADVTVSSILCVPILALGVRARHQLPDRGARRADVHRHRRARGASRSPASATRSRSRPATRRR